MLDKYVYGLRDFIIEKFSYSMHFIFDLILIITILVVYSLCLVVMAPPYYLWVLLGRLSK